MHIGGGLSRIRAGAQTVHLAQILASTGSTACGERVDTLRSRPEPVEGRRS